MKIMRRDPVIKTKETYRRKMTVCTSKEIELGDAKNRIMEDLESQGQDTEMTVKDTDRNAHSASNRVILLKIAGIEKITRKQKDRQVKQETSQKTTQS